MKHLKRYTQLFESVQELSQEQRDWLDKCSKGSWKLNPKTGLVDVRGGFECDRQGLDSFNGVRFGTVSGHFNCSDNRLTSLEGAPQSVGVDFYCHDNPISERAIKEVLKRMSDKNISLEQAVAEYWESIPEDDKIYLAKHHPSLPEEEKRIYRAMELNMKRR